MDIWDLTAHQLDVIRTIFAAVGATGGLFGGLAAIFSFLSRKWAKQAASNTTSSEWKHGRLVQTPVSESARHAAQNGEATRQEIGDLAGWIKGTGRRRMPTTDVPRLPPDESTYQ